MVRLIKTCSAVKNLQQLAQDADLALLQVQHRRSGRMAAALYITGRQDLVILEAEIHFI